MNMRHARILVILGLWALGAAWNYGTFDRRAEILRRYQPRFVVLPRPEVARAASLGFRAVIADFYWIGTVNYFGDQRHARLAYAELPNYLELVLALDPDFEYAYLFGGMALPWNKGDGWVNIDSAISVLERGVKRFPNNWKMRFQLAYTYSAYRSRFKDAGDQLTAAALLPGSPPYVGRLATRMYATTGDYDGALIIAETIFNSTDDPEIKEGIIRRAAEIKVIKDIDFLENAVKLFAQKYQHFPMTLSDLVLSGIINVIPRESLGGIFEYDPSTGKVASSVLHERLKIHEQP